MKKLNLVWTIIFSCSLLLQLSPLCSQSRAAVGDVDLSFDPGSGVNGTVNAMVVQPDGKLIIGGEFTVVKGLVRKNLARLNADGSGDSSFVSAPMGYPVSSLALQPDGKVLVGSKNDIWDAAVLTRLNADGSPDTNFNANATNLAIAVYCIVLQPDGKILYSVVEAGDEADPHLVRLNSNGTRDTNFTELGGYVYSMALQADGKVIAAGYSLNYSGSYGILRINPNGGIDNTFNSAVSNLVLQAIVVQSDGKVLIGGEPFWVNETNLTSLARLNANGSVDPTFSQGPGAGSMVLCMSLQADGKVIIGGGFVSINGQSRTNLARLNANGSLDMSFQNGTDGFVKAIGLQTNGTLLIGGTFTNVNGTNRGGIARLQGDGTLDATFQPGHRVGPVSSLVVQADGKVLIGGATGEIFWENRYVLTFINGTNHYARARLNVDGSPDLTFVAGTNFNPDLLAVRRFDDCPAGNFGCYPLAWASTVAVQPDGKVLIGGVVRTEVSGDEFHEFYYSPILGRFHADGSLDTNFATTFRSYDSAQSGEIEKLIVQPDGQILVAGGFTSINGTNRPGLARLNTNGTLDLSFAPATGASTIALQPDGKVLIAGHGFARLNADGSFDSSFNSITGTNGHGSALAVQPDGKVLIGGSFTNVNGTNLTSIARLNADGSLDGTFNPGTVVPSSVNAIALQSDGDVLIGGDFLSINGVVRPYVARLHGDSLVSFPSLDIARSNAFVIVSWPASSIGYSLQESTNLSSASSWLPVAQPTITDAGQISITLPANIGSKFFRLKSQ